MGACTVSVDEGGSDTLRGRVTITYGGRHDGVMIYAQVTGSNSLVSFESCNGKAQAGTKSRLFVPSADMPDGTADFVAKVEPAIKAAHEIRVRAAIIEQHKEVDSSVVFVSRG